MDLELKSVEKNILALPLSVASVVAQRTALSEIPKNNRLGKAPP